MKFLLKILFIGVCLGCVGINGEAQIATYNSANTVNATPSSDTDNPYADQYITPTYGTAGLLTTTVSNLTLGSGVTGTNLYQYGFGLAFSTGGSATLAAAEANNAYFGFTVTPNAGMYLDLSALDFSGGRFYSQDNETDQLSRTLYLESSVNGFTTLTTLGSITLPANAFTAGTDLTLGSAFSALQGTTEFRLYIVDPDTNVYESIALSGTDALSIDGMTEIVPEPSTYALLGCGLVSMAVLWRNRRRLA